MNKIFTAATATFLAIATLSSCVKKDYNSNVTTTPTNTNNQGGTFHIASYDDVNHLYAAIKPAAQSFTVTVGSMQTITTAKGSRVNFYPNSFKNASGVTLTSGTVNISLTEASRIADMIGTRALPVSTTGVLLTSGGEMNITATMGGKQCMPTDMVYSSVNPPQPRNL